MKILIVTETLDEGGAELFVLRLARALLAKGEKVQVLSLNKQYENKGMTAKFQDLPIQRFSIPFLPLIELTDKILTKLNIDFSFKYYWQGRKLRKIVAGYDIVHSHYIQADYLVASIKKGFSFKHIVTVHGDYSAQYDSFQKGELRFWLRLDKKLIFLSRSVDQWVVLSEEQRNFLLQKMSVNANRITKIYNGFLPPAEEVSIERSGFFTIGMVARGTEKKGWQKLINAFLKLPQDTRLLLVGSGEYIASLKQKYSSENRIIFTGFESDPIRRMKQMDVFVLPTLYPFESLPNVITEALYCDLPVIATNVGEIENMITGNVTRKKAGAVIGFDGENIDEEELYEKIKLLYDNPAVRKEMGLIAKDAFQKFSMGKCVNAYQETYKRSLS